jgi:hypothetical protein
MAIVFSFHSEVEVEGHQRSTEKSLIFPKQIPIANTYKEKQ